MKIIGCWVEDIFNKYFKLVFIKAVNNTIDLAKIMVPIIIALKFLQEINLIDYLVYPFTPIMALLGLPAVYALVWVGAIFNTNYTALFLIIALFNSYPITYEQVTVIGVLCLLAHSIITEGAIVSKFGLNPYFLSLVRFITAIILAYVTHIVFSLFNIGQEIINNSIFDQVKVIPPTFLDYYKQQGFSGNYSMWSLGMLNWVYSQLKVIVIIFIVLLLLFFLVQLIKDLKIADLIAKSVKPITKVIGIKPQNNLIMFLCYIIGLSYGFGLLKEEIKTNPDFSNEQAFKILLFVAIAHAIVEDSLIFIFLGANWWIVILGRTIMGFLAVWVSLKILHSKFASPRIVSIFYKANK